MTIERHLAAPAMRIGSKNGADVWINLSILILGAEGRAAATVVHLFRDVTQRRQVEDRVQKAMGSLRRFIFEDLGNAAEQVDPAPTPLPQVRRHRQGRRGGVRRAHSIRRP